MAKIADQFKGLPIGELIANPLIAAAQAQGKLAGVTEQFIEEVGLEKDGEKLKARTVEFGYDVPVQNPKTGDVSVEKRNLNVPLLSIVNTPNLSVKNVTVDFDMTVKSSTEHKDSTEAKVSTKASYSAWWSPVKASMTASVANKSENTRKTDNSARYTVHVEARDDGAPEGLMKVLDILHDSMKPAPNSVKDLPAAKPEDQEPASGQTQ
tara:strand:+ start:2347 stop:2973 length:627 start_codon:yes stop_codon:yes gene_type:complete